MFPFNELGVYGLPQLLERRVSFDWAPRLSGGATRPDAISGMDPRFRTNLEAMLSAAPGGLGLGLKSGYRSAQRQSELWANALKRYGSATAARKWVAPPGRSQHGMGLAADMTFGSGAARSWAHENAPKYGLAFPLGHEPWHIELAGARGQGADYAGAPVPQTGNVPATPAANGIGSMLGLFGNREPMTGLVDVPQFQPKPMTPEDFLKGMISGRNPLKQMVFNRIAGLFA